MEKSIRGDEDMYRPYTAQQRYRKNRVVTLEPENRILPTPLSVQPVVPKTTLVISSSDWKILYGRELRNEANYLRGIVVADVVFWKLLHVWLTNECSGQWSSAKLDFLNLYFRQVTRVISLYGGYLFVNFC